uniref:Ranatuerin-2 n=1 Tax=Aquarana catesbeiana TaxID=8400 RepID=RN2X2_AQUCT|nr:RecName: Full=Ranatuerin-2 [Aquarana catesbeiana]
GLFLDTLKGAAKDVAGKLEGLKCKITGCKLP